MSVDLVKYLQEKLNAIAPNLYEVSSERNINAKYEKNEVVISALSGPIYKDSSNIPYQIDIVTKDISSVMIDFTTLAKQENEQSFTEITQTGESNYQSSTITPVFNSPVVVEKDIQIGSNRYARIVVFAVINEVSNVNNIKELKIDGETIEKLSSNLIYTTEAVSNRVSGEKLNRSKKKAASCSVTFSMINKASVFANKAFKIFSGVLDGNTKFEVKVVMDNGLETTLPMFINTYTFNDERAKLPSVNVGMLLYDDRGDSNA